MTRRLRAWTSPVVLYSRQSASASSGEILFFPDDEALGAVLGFVAVFMTAGCSWGRCTSGGRCRYRPRVHTPTSPIRGNRPLFEPVRPGEHLGHREPQVLGHLLPQREPAE